MIHFKNSLYREFKRFSTDRSLLLLTVILPVLMAGAYLLLFSKGEIQDIPVAVCDNDKTTTSRQVVSMINATPALKVSLDARSMQQAHEALQKGEVFAIVNIPEGMEKGVMGASGAQISAYVNGAYITNATIALRDLTTVFQAFNIGAQSSILTAKGVSPQQSYDSAYPIVIQKHVLFNPLSSYSYYLLPGLMSMILVVIIVLSTVYVVGSELRYSTAPNWLETAGGNMSRAVITKLIPYFFIFVLILLFFNTALYRFLGLPMNANNFTVVIIGNLFFILSHMALGMILITLLFNMRLAMSIGGGIAIASFSLSGLTFPHMGMYPFVEHLAQFVPFTHYMKLFIDSSMRGAPAIYGYDEIFFMSIFILIAFMLVPLLKKRCLNPKCFGKL